MIEIKSKREIELMKEACKITALAHKAIEESIKPGISTFELNNILIKYYEEKLTEINLIKNKEDVKKYYFQNSYTSFFAYNVFRIYSCWLWLCISRFF